MKRNRSVFSILALLVVMILALLPTVSSAQTAVTPNKLDTYTLNLSAPVAPVFSAQATTTVSPWSGAFFYDIRSKHADAVVLNKILDLTKNAKLSGFSLYGFAGTTVDKNGKAVAGLAIGKDWKWFDQVSFFTGVGVSFSASTPVGGGFLVGASVKF